MRIACLFFAVPTLAFSALISDGDAAFKRREVKEEALRAVEIYQKLSEQNPNNPEILWRVAMANHFAGMRFIDSHEKRMEIYEVGYRAGKKSVELQPNCAPCHFWTAVALALYSKERGIFSSLAYLSEVEQHLETTIKLDPTYAAGGPYRILGRIQEALPGILGGDNDKALTYYEKAVETAPQEPLNYLFLIRMHQELDSPRETTLALLERARHLPEPKPEFIESRESLAEIRNLVVQN